jgi:hypothetical protein
MSRAILGVLATVVVLTSPSAAPAWYWSRPAVSCTYGPVLVYAAGPVAFPAPVFTPVPAPYPVVQAVPVFPGMTSPPPAGPYANPSPAPPSQSPLAAPPATPAPPLAPSLPMQKVQEERSSNAPGVEDPHFYDLYPVATRNPNKPAGERSSVAFWNLSDRDLTLKVAGQIRTLPRGQKVGLELARKFTWQVDERQPREETVAVTDPGLEIVIRR